MNYQLEDLIMKLPEEERYQLIDSLKGSVDNLSSEGKDKLKEYLETRFTPAKYDRPPKGQEYYYIDTTGDLNRSKYFGIATSDENRYLLGNYFLNPADARFYAEKLKVLTELRRLSSSNPVNWKNRQRLKYCISYDHETNSIRVSTAGDMQTHDTNYFSSRIMAEKAIEAIGYERLKKYYFEVLD